MRPDEKGVTCPVCGCEMRPIDNGCFHCDCCGTSAGRPVSGYFDDFPPPTP